jgi:hypothetical protein
MLERGLPGLATNRAIESALGATDHAVGSKSRRDHQRPECFGVWQAREGRVVRLEHRPEIARAQHAPQAYLSERSRQLRDREQRQQQQTERRRLHPHVDREGHDGR